MSFNLVVQHSSSKEQQRMCKAPPFSPASLTSLYNFEKKAPRCNARIFDNVCKVSVMFQEKLKTSLFTFLTPEWSLEKG